jgi:hypothetical protein
MSLVNIFVAPTAVFKRLNTTKRWSLLALLLLIVTNLVANHQFFNNMSPEWLVEQQLLEIGEMNAEEEKTALENLTKAAPKVGIAVGLFGTLFLFVSPLLFAFYYLGVSKISNLSNDLGYGYADWFSFSIWVQMPQLINVIGFIVLFSTDVTNDLPIKLEGYASLNQVLLNLPIGDPLFSWAESINLFSLWSIILVAIGLAKCVNMNIAKATVYASAPVIAFYAIWWLTI